jgi:subtilisin family serine protease
MRLACVVIAGAALAAPASASASDRLLVGFEKDVSKKRQEQILEDAGGRISQRFSSRGGRLVVVSPGTDALRKELGRSPAVAYAEKDYLQRASATPNDPYYGFDYALVDGPDDHDIDAPGTWGARTSCAKVAILDTGVDTDHPDLAPNVHKSDDKPNNGKDDDKNGYVDDTYGYDAIKGKGSGEDDNGHGTHVAGIVGARGNNAGGTAGACWSVKLGAVKFMNAKGKGSTSDAIEGIEWAVEHGFKIVNCSFGSSSKSSALHDAVDYAQSKNVLLVVAAGNDGDDIDSSPVYPASFGDSNILAVAASTSTDTLASFSNYGDEAVDVAAPGDSIFSTYLGGGYKVLSGTSMAAPYAAGVAALLRKQESDATYGDLRYAIRHKVDKPPALDGKVAYDGRLNAARAMSAIGSLVD